MRSDLQAAIASLSLFACKRRETGLRLLCLITFFWISVTVLPVKARQPKETFHRRFNPRRQLVYRLAHGLTEVVLFLPGRSSIKGFTDIGAVKPKLDVILFVGYGFLVDGETDARRDGTGGGGEWKRTLIIVSRTLTEPKTALAGATLTISSAKFIASMATVKDERAPPGTFCCREFVAIVENGGSCGKTTRKRGCEEEAEY